MELLVPYKRRPGVELLAAHAPVDRMEQFVPPERRPLAKRHGAEPTHDIGVVITHVDISVLGGGEPHLALPTAV